MNTLVRFSKVKPIYVSLECSAEHKFCVLTMNDGLSILEVFLSEEGAEVLREAVNNPRGDDFLKRKYGDTRKDKEE